MIWQIILENLRWKYCDPDELHTVHPKKPLFHRNHTISNQMRKRPKFPPCLWSIIELEILVVQTEEFFYSNNQEKNIRSEERRVGMRTLLTIFAIRSRILMSFWMLKYLIPSCNWFSFKDGWLTVTFYTGMLTTK